MSTGLWHVADTIDASLVSAALDHMIPKILSQHHKFGFLYRLHKDSQHQRGIFGVVDES
jgi:hypothetical protein